MTGLAALKPGPGGGGSGEQEAGGGRAGGRLARCVLRSCAGAFLSQEPAVGGGGATAPPSPFRNVDAIYK